jgi:hypothetical protein
MGERMVSGRTFELVGYLFVCMLARAPHSLTAASENVVDVLLAQEVR